MICGRTDLVGALADFEAGLAAGFPGLGGLFWLTIAPTLCLAGGIK